MMFSVFVFSAAVLLLVCIAAGTDLLRRQPITACAGNNAAHIRRRPPFSLGRLQMAWWFLITLAAFVALAASRHQVRGVMNPQTVLILAIAAGTLLGAAWLDRATGTTGQPMSGGVLADILCDTGGLCLHRLQLLIWSVVLGASFVWTVVTDASMPMFDGYTLAVLAISGGTYVGFKSQETRLKIAA